MQSSLFPLRVLHLDADSLWQEWVRLSFSRSMHLGQIIYMPVLTPSVLLSHLSPDFSGVILLDFVSEKAFTATKETLSQIRQGFPHIPVFILSQLADIGSFHPFFSLDVSGYLSKNDMPDHFCNRFLDVVQRTRYLKNQEYEADEDIEELAQNILVKKVKSVLLRGESGSGKEHVAQIFRKLQGTGRPFVTINCAAFNNEIYESVLFGHNKGAYTGAHLRHTGAFERAHTGILFLDEIACLNLRAQAAILRAIELGEFAPLGGDSMKVDVLILSATNENLEELIAASLFRNDLYQRLKGFELRIPSYRERSLVSRNKILDTLLENLNIGCHKYRLHDETRKFFLEQSFSQGNIREMRHTLEGAALRSRNSILYPQDLSQSFVNQDAGIKSSSKKERIDFLNWEEHEEGVFLEYLEGLEECSDSLSHLAQRIGLTRFKCKKKMRSLQNKGKLPSHYQNLLKG